MLLSPPPWQSLLLLILKCGGLRRSFAFQLASIVLLLRWLTERAKCASSSCCWCYCRRLLIGVESNMHGIL